MAFLVYGEGPSKGKRIELPSSGVVKFGRSAEKCDVVVEGDTVSGCHCSIEKTDTGFRVKDLGSTNKTWLNGEDVAEADLYWGDELSMGDTVFSVDGEGLPRRSEQKPGPVESYSDTGTKIMHVVPRSVRDGRVSIPTSFSRRNRGVRLFSLLVWAAVIAVAVLLYVFFKGLS